VDIRRKDVNSKNETNVKDGNAKSRSKMTKGANNNSVNGGNT
jgi:hypothetical protein